jgi:hypothetical protein
MTQCLLALGACFGGISDQANTSVSSEGAPYKKPPDWEQHFLMRQGLMATGLIFGTSSSRPIDSLSVITEYFLVARKASMRHELSVPQLGD